MKLLIFFGIVALFYSKGCLAQDDFYNATQPAVPAVMRTQLSSNEIYTEEKTNTIISSETSFQYAINISSAINVYIPVLSNAKSKQLGLSDARFTFTKVIKRNISRTFIALIGSLEAITPTGSTKAGLGGGRWLLQPTVSGLFAVSKAVLFIPSITYEHYTVSDSKSYKSYPVNGFSVQPYVNIRATSHLFFGTSVSVNTQYSHNTAKSYYAGQVNAFYLFHQNRYRLNAGWNPNVTSNVNIFSGGVTAYF